MWRLFLHHCVKFASEFRSFFREVRRWTRGTPWRSFPPEDLEAKKIEPRRTWLIASTESNESVSLRRPIEVRTFPDETSALYRTAGRFLLMLEPHTRNLETHAASLAVTPPAYSDYPPLKLGRQDRHTMNW
jgi:hypothetical protein